MSVPPARRPAALHAFTRLGRSHLGAFLTAGVLACVLGACGSSDGSNEVVARVAGVGTLTKATLEHWIPVEGVIIYQEDPTVPVPKGVVPDPPRFAACVDYLRKTPQKLVETGPKPTTAQLKEKCNAKYEELKILTLNTLIDWDWTIGYGMQLGVHVSGAEARRWLREYNARTYPQPSAYRRYLKLTGQTQADMIFRAKIDLFEKKLIAKREELAKHGQKQAVLEFDRASPPSKEWAAKTSCHVGYIGSVCKQYRGTEPPGLPN